MPFIPRQVKPPARLAITCKVPEQIATLLKQYAEFLDSSQEYVVAETLRLAFRKDKEFHAWLSATHPETRMTEPASPAGPGDQSAPAPATTAADSTAARARRTSTMSDQQPARTESEPVARGERARS